MKTYALVDCNNFYASCERLFRPDLQGRPIVVLSNNDGCVVARSAEARAMGVKMGEPYFKVKQAYEQAGGIAFSSNYALYGDISSRVMQVLEMLAPAVEVYSIDEAFLELSGVANTVALEEFGQQLRATIARWVGITVGVGMAPTKTLAKLANHAAKKWPATGGVVDLGTTIRQHKLMAITPVAEVWGIGRRLTQQLEALGIGTALDLARMPPTLARKRFSVVLERTIMELNGVACIPWEQGPAPKKQIINSRSFGEYVTDYSVMRQAVCQYAARAAEKLRQEQQYCRLVQVFIRTSPFASHEPKYSNHAAVTLPLPTADTRDIVAAVVKGLEQIWRPGYRYQKAGVMLLDFWPSGTYQPGLFDCISERPQSQALMQVMDAINHSGRGRVFLAGEGLSKEWQMKRAQLSPAYTTRVKELPLAY
ncbi:translesion error-prone DNA polymerase V subunit UmuC [Oceanimonas sp. AH20CE76]|uniref:translesion error-prone DNA polymerase V subunit UmuC n=1 Tax=Oceanimonas sp. AH20CE76 TaxID=2977120 RepID=UPI0031FEC3FD